MVEFLDLGHVESSVSCWAGFYSLYLGTVTELFHDLCFYTFPSLYYYDHCCVCVYVSLVYCY